jgi:uncharacterized Zn-finger protein
MEPKELFFGSYGIDFVGPITCPYCRNAMLLEYSDGMADSILCPFCRDVFFLPEVEGLGIPVKSKGE